MATVIGSDRSETLGWLNGVTNGNDVIYGYGGDDYIYARHGDDTIKGGGGADRLDGSDGNDTASYLDSSTGVSVSLATGRGSGGTAEGDTLEDIENLIGSQHSDTLTGDSGSNTLIGGGGQDTLKGGGGADTLSGGDGHDQLKGGGGADTLNGGAGLDEANYSSSAEGVTITLMNGRGYRGDAEGDTLSSIENVTGSAHRDYLWGDNGSNVLRGGGGDDWMWGGGGIDSLFGGQGHDTLLGMEGTDVLYGEAGDDYLDGGVGNDTMKGGTGNDQYYVDASGDVINEEAAQGNDTVYSSALGYTLSANVETLSLDTVTDTGVYGTGNAQANNIYGNQNHNVLEGGGGADFLNGMGGSDNFVFRPGQANGDRVHDFQGNGTGVGDFMYFIGYGTAAQGASFVQLSANTWQINSANGQTHDVVTFSGNTSIDASDFVFI